MSLKLPDKIPVAAETYEALLRLGSPWPLDPKLQSLVIVTNDVSDPCMVWASPKLTTYRAVWSKAAGGGFVEHASEWGDNVDIDHVFPRSWANLSGSNVNYVRLFPVWAEINRQAGGGREKNALRVGVSAPRTRGIIFAQELQVLKILGHEVGTVSDPVEIFGSKRRS
ncbi:hypothetical protein [Bradyrhizobium genosp. A]|uniref:hypothetical protein n=1 Tax=Bradyrhizobium genosp. A TaxID=83626 RepID=UPI003CF6CC4B